MINNTVFNADINAGVFKFNELMEIEKIKRLKARYLRGLDTNDWELFAATMTPDCTGNYSGGKLQFENRERLVAYMRENLSGSQIVTMHQCHQAEIDVLGETHAEGVWYLHDIVLVLDHKLRIYGTAIYRDHYVKLGGEWLIKSTGYQRVFEASEPLAESHQILQSWFEQEG
jgi:hypothetical protein